MGGLLRKKGPRMVLKVNAHSKEGTLKLSIALFQSAGDHSLKKAT